MATMLPGEDPPQANPRDNQMQQGIFQPQDTKNRNEGFATFQEQQLKAMEQKLGIKSKSNNRTSSKPDMDRTQEYGKQDLMALRPMR